ncbi:MAG: hypothetical protein LBS17_01680 [Actinomycetes bacterium]|jgi:hypothetical protein|nr:hypothetical protein [Actinomycetes bacterium]
MRGLDTVEMPEKGVVLKRRSDTTTYVYYTLRSYRNSKGKPTSDTVLIGKLDHATGRLIPNARYRQLFPVGTRVGDALPHIRQNAQTTDGLAWVLELVARRIQLRSCLRDAWPGMWREIQAVVFWLAAAGRTDGGFGDGSELELSATSPVVEGVLSALTERSQRRFFKRWAALRLEEDFQCFDVNLDVASPHPVADAPWGQADVEAGPTRYTVWAFVGKDTGLPLYYNRLPNFDYPSQALQIAAVVRDSAYLGMKHIGFAFGQSIVTVEALEAIDAQTPRFVAPFPKHMPEYARLLRDWGGPLRRPENWVPGLEYYGRHVQFGLAGRQWYALFYWSADDYADYERALFRRVAAGETADEARIADELAGAGYRAYTTNDPDLPVDYVPRLYRIRRQFEEVFEQVSMIPEYRTLPFARQATKDGTSFLGFLAVTMRLALLAEIRRNDETRDYSWNRVMSELSRLEFATLPNGELLPHARGRDLRAIVRALRIH